MTEKRYEEVWKHGKIIGAKDTKNHVSMNVKTMIRELNSQDERIETLKEDVEIILDYVLNKGKFAMNVKEQKAHNRLRGFVRGDVE